jgi:hypothetical protein
MGRRYLFNVVLLLVSAFSTPAGAARLNLGFISYDVLIPSDIGTPGVNVFNVSNFTGDPLAGGFALPPDFPAFAALTLVGSSLTLDDGGPPNIVPLGNIGPGPMTPPLSLQFADTASFSSAVFTATLSQTRFLLSDGFIFEADSSAVTATLLPSVGPSLAAGSDFAIIAVEGQIVPEPGSLMLTAVTLAGGLIYARSHRRA